MASAPGVIGKAIRIKGDLSGAGDLIIEGQVEGRIQMTNHVTIEQSGVVNANIAAEKLTVLGRASGNIEAQAKVEMRSTATVEGEIRAPSVVMEDGASFHGNIQMDVGIPEDI